MTASTVATLWLGSNLSLYEQLSLRSFSRSGIAVTLYVYEDVADIPLGVNVVDGSSIVLKKHVFRNPDSPSYAMFSNLFRYEMIQQTGQAWIDADLVKLRQPLPDCEYVFAYESHDAIAAGLVRMPSGSLLIQKLLEGVRPMLSPDQRNVPWGTYGPRLLTTAVNELGLQRFALNARDVYPIHYLDMNRLFSTDSRDVEWCQLATSDSMTLHLWNKFLADSGQKEFGPHPNSYLGELMRSNDIEVRPPFVESRLLRTRSSLLRKGARRFTGLVRALTRQR